MYHSFNHAVPMNRVCVVMSCLEMDVGKSHGIAFSMTVQRDFQCFKSGIWLLIAPVSVHCFSSTFGIIW